MTRYVFLLLLAACSGLELEDDGGSVPDAQHGPIVAVNARLCRPKTTGVLIGDSISPIQTFPSAQVLSGRPILEFDGDTIISQATGGIGYATALSTWQASAERGNPAIGWVFIQLGVNDIHGGGKTAAQVLAGIQAIIADIRANNPGAKIIVGQIPVARGGITAGEYTIWLAANVLLAGIGAKAEINNAISNHGLSDGAGGIDGLCGSGDGIHMNQRGTATIAIWIRAWVTQAFGGQRPCGAP